MKFGAVDGKVKYTEQIVFDSVISGSAVTSINTGDILNGDVDEWYTIIFKHIRGSNDSLGYLSFNADTTDSHYGYRGIYGASTTVADFSSTTSRPYLSSSYTTYTCSMAVVKVYAKTGQNRWGTNLLANGIASTLVDTVRTSGFVWNNSADNITSIQITSDTASGIGVGSRLTILKHSNTAVGMSSGAVSASSISKTWTRISSTILGADSASLTISGLDGDRDVVYRVSIGYKSSGVTGYVGLYLNSDSGASSYKRQYILAYSTSIVGYRDTGDAFMSTVYAATTAYNSFSDLYIHASSGYVRPAVGRIGSDITGTAIGAQFVHGMVWQNTADNITSMAFAPEAANMGAGTQIDIYALRPNG